MVRLYILEEGGKLVAVEEYPFVDEVNDMEAFIKTNYRLLGDIIIFGEQVVSSSKSQRVDLFAVNKDGEILIIELKKEVAVLSILSQVLDYRAYWKTSIEAVKNMWNDFGSKPEGISPDWGSFDPGIMVVAPSMEERLLEVSGLNELPIDFVEVKRYKYGGKVFATVDIREPRKIPTAPITGRRLYDWAWYENSYGSTAAELARHYHDALLKLIEKRTWDLAPKYNKFYIPFSYGGHNAFWVEFPHKGKVSIAVNKEVKVDPSDKTGMKWSRNKSWGYWYLELETKELELTKIEPVLEEAYNSVLSG